MPTHAETRVLPYAPRELYELVADVERYPEFLPWCLGARVRKRQGVHIEADLIIGFKMIREKFTSKITLNPGHRIDVSYAEGPFKYMNNHWIFKPHSGGVEIDFFVDFEFKNKILQRVMETLFSEAVKRMVAAFEARAKHLYGAGLPSPSA